MKNALLILLSASVLIGCKKPGEREERDLSIKEEIQKLENDYALAVSKKAVDSILPYYADDAISYDAEAKPLKGKSSIRASIKNEASAYPPKESVEFKVEEIYPFNNGEQVLEIGHYDIKDEKGLVFGSGNYFALFEKRDGKYVCIRDIQTPDTPKKLPPKK